MLKIQTVDGGSRRLDLRDPEQAQRLVRELQSPQYQEQLRAMGLVVNYPARCSSCGRRECAACGGTTNKGIQYTMTAPQDFDTTRFHVDRLEPDPEAGVKGGIKVVCFADDVRLTVMTHRVTPAVTISLRKMGKQRYNPLAD